MKYSKVLVITDVGNEFDGKVMYTNNLIGIFGNVCNELSVISFNDKFLHANKISKSIEFKKENSNLTLRYLLSPKPMMACRSFDEKIASFLIEKSHKYDLCVISHHSMLWANEYIPSSVKKVFVTHNIETEVALSRLSVNYNPINIIFSLIDYLKHSQYEKKYLSNDLVISAISNYDSNFYQKKYPNRLIKILPYTYPKDNFSTLKNIEAIIIGSFYWKLKQDNLISFLDIAQKKLEQNRSVNIKIVGGMEEAFKHRLQEKYNVEVHANVKSISDSILDSRIGLIIDKAGGGFKLKILDYISYGLPIYSIKEGITDDINGKGKGFFVFDTYEELIDKVLDDIYDQESLMKKRDLLLEYNQNLLQPTEIDL